MSEEIHFLEDGYYVNKLEKDIQKLKEKCNQLQTMVKIYKDVIDEVRDNLNNALFGIDLDSIDDELLYVRVSLFKELLQILGKTGESNE